MEFTYMATISSMRPGAMSVFFIVISPGSRVCWINIDWQVMLEDGTNNFRWVNSHYSFNNTIALKSVGKNSIKKKKQGKLS